MPRPAAVLASAALLAAGPALGATPIWITSWGEALDAAAPKSRAQLNNVTLRQAVHLSAGGNALRLRISNAFGEDVLSLGAAHIGRARPAGAVVAGSDQALSFAGKQGVDIPAHGEVLSDPLASMVPAQAELAVTLYVRAGESSTAHEWSASTNYLAPGDQSAAMALQGASTRGDRLFLSGIDVTGPQARASVVALGDSITDGVGSTVDGNNRWPDVLGAVLTHAYGDALGVVNVGISGNTILPGTGPIPGAVDRLGRDVFIWPNGRYLLVLEGINDCIWIKNGSLTGEALIAADRRIVAAAHARGFKVYGATVMPFGGSWVYGVQGEHARQILNTFIRHGNLFDAAVDLDAQLRDPEQPDRLLKAYDSGDHIHPTPAGDAVIAHAFPAAWFKG